MLCKVADQGIHIVYKLPRLITNVSRKNIDSLQLWEANLVIPLEKIRVKNIFPLSKMNSSVDL